MNDSIFKAPDGLEFFQHAPAETKYVYEEIFEQRIYCRHGIDFKPDETVLDVGANIGMFSVFVMEKFPGLKVHAFEPGPEIFTVLKANVAKYGSAVTAHQCGIAGRSGQATFTYYPGYSIMSGFHAEAARDRTTLRAGIRSHLLEQDMAPEAIQDRFVNRMVESALGEKREYVCRLRTISEIIDEAGIEQVGLAKIDAEGSELDILKGICPEHWPRFRQVVMEIHDPAGAETVPITNLLTARGFKCVVEEEKRLAGSGVVNCYALRS